MHQMTLKFSGSAEWVRDKACSDIASNTQATATVKLGKRPNTGTFVLVADTKERLDAAYRYLMSHHLYKSHFTT